MASSGYLVYLLFVAVAKVNEQFLVAHQLYCWIQFDAVAFCTNGLHKVTLNGYLLRGYQAECSCFVKINGAVHNTQPMNGG